ncbi:SAM-dependent methyltransferase [Nonomuraea insulae]|uniref:SAM-dependent methyltransferase n=1 Tax=Nonomuraea insulae TaxID=1616787 RepID=A0ABW1CV75_9ACTN
MVLGDARRPEEILAAPEVRELLDLDRPVAVLMMFVLHLIGDEDDPRSFMAAYRSALAPGSYLAISHVTNDVATERTAQVTGFYRKANADFTPRPGKEIAAFFGDFELIPPGLATGLPTHQVWPFADPVDPILVDDDLARMAYAGIGRKP